MRLKLLSFIGEKIKGMLSMHKFFVSALPMRLKYKIVNVGSNFKINIVFSSP
jgi:hypothetical protein